MPLLGLDTDNGGEFLNTDLLAYCEREQITFTRGRVAKKNDQCYVEQKNGAIVRQLVGYDRFEGEHAYRQLAELYRAVRLYVNFFQPSMKLRLKERAGGKLRRRYDPAKTPFQRLLTAGVLSTSDRVRLTGIAQRLDPVQLLRQIGQLQNALWRHAMTQMPGSGPEMMSAVSGDAPTIRFTLDASATNETTARGESEGGRKYRRTKGVKGLRLYRTRPDPFADSMGGDRAGTDGASGADGEGGLRKPTGTLPWGVPGESAPDAATASAGVADARDPGVRRPVAQGRRACHAVLPTAFASDDGASRERPQW